MWSHHASKLKSATNGDSESVKVVVFLRREDLGKTRSRRGGCSASYRNQPLHNMVATRLRKTFRYPADNSDDDDVPKDLDEEGYYS